MIWIPSVSSPMSLVTLSTEASLCFARMIKPHLNLDKEAEELVRERPGIKVKIYGFSPDTKAKNNCGSSALGDLLPLPL